MATCNGNLSLLPLMTAVSVGSGLSKPQLHLLHEIRAIPQLSHWKERLFRSSLPHSLSLCSSTRGYLLTARSHCRHPATIFKVLLR